MPDQLATLSSRPVERLKDSDDYIEPGQAKKLWRILNQYLLYCWQRGAGCRVNMLSANALHI